MGTLNNSTGVTSVRSMPTALTTMLNTMMVQYFVSLGNITQPKLQHYAGEFLAEDNMNRLKANVSQFSHVFYDIEAIEDVDTDSTQNMPETMFRFIIFCATSNRFDESLQWSSSYDLAWDIKQIFTGSEFTNVADIHANGYFEPQTIERELNVPGMSVHTLRIDAVVTYDAEGLLNVDNPGGFLFDDPNNSIYLGMLGGMGTLPLRPDF